MVKADLQRFDFDKVIFDKGYLRRGKGNEDYSITGGEKWRKMIDMLMPIAVKRNGIIEPKEIYEYLKGMQDV